MPNAKLDPPRLVALLGRANQRGPVGLAKLAARGVRELLKRLAVEQVGFQPGFGKLLGDELGRQVDALGADAAPFEFVGAQVAGVVGQPLLDRGRLLGVACLGGQREER